MDVDADFRRLDRIDWRLGLLGLAPTNTLANALDFELLLVRASSLVLLELLPGGRRRSDRIFCWRSWRSPIAWAVST